MGSTDRDKALFRSFCVLIEEYSVSLRSGVAYPPLPPPPLALLPPPAPLPPRVIDDNKKKASNIQYRQRENNGEGKSPAEAMKETGSHPEKSIYIIKFIWQEQHKYVLKTGATQLSIFS